MKDLAAAEALRRLPFRLSIARNTWWRLESLTNLQPFIAWRAEQRQDRGPWHLFALAPGSGVFSGEPERSRRVLNMLVANDLAW